MQERFPGPKRLLDPAHHEEFVLQFFATVFPGVHIACNAATQASDIDLQVLRAQFRRVKIYAYIFPRYGNFQGASLSKSGFVQPTVADAPLLAPSH